MRIDTDSIEIISPRGFFRRKLADVAQVDRAPGRLALALKDGSRRVIPSIVRDLDGIVSEIASRRSKLTAGTETSL